MSMGKVEEVISEKDGVNPFKGSQYTMWPLLFKILNYAPELASKTELVLLAGVIHGPNAPKSLQPVLKLLIEELVDLWSGVTVPMASGGAEFIPSNGQGV